MRQAREAGDMSSQERLFMSLADGMQHTMLQLALLGEQARVGSEGCETAMWQSVTDISRASLQLLEAYTLVLRLQGSAAPPELEPIALTSLLYDTLHVLEPYAKQAEIALELHMPRRLEPVVSDRTILQAAFVGLGQVIILAQAEADTDQAVVRLGAHRSRHGIVAGWYGHDFQLTNAAFSRAKKLSGWAQQPYSELANGSAAGVFMAESLLESLSRKLHVARYRSTCGLAVTLPACQQLKMV